jgi:putative aminopeptidase FrvX
VQTISDYTLLKSLCQVHGPSGNESGIKAFILDYVLQNQATWKTQPTILEGEDFQDCLVLVFGNPTTAIFAHMDTVGFTVRYGNELVKIGGPRIRHLWTLKGKDTKGEIVCDMIVPEGATKASYRFEREIERGTDLTFTCDFRESDDFVQSCYLDNRLGCFIALQVAATLENGVICFSCYEEMGGGSTAFLGKYIYEKLGVKQALISDITWMTDGIRHGKGVAISLRDSGVPRKAYLNRIVALAKASEVPFQLEVEDAGGSDGNVLQKSPYPFDWCFIGAPEDNVHTPDEKVHKNDISAMYNLYHYLMKNL